MKLIINTISEIDKLWQSSHFHCASQVFSPDAKQAALKHRVVRTPHGRRANHYIHTESFAPSEAFGLDTMDTKPYFLVKKRIYIFTVYKMNTMPEFVTAIREHESLGYLVSAYFIEPEGDRNYKILQRATYTDAENPPENLTEVEKKIVRIIDGYSDQNLMKIYSKKKVSQLQFLKSLSRGGLSERIRPFLDKQIFKIYELVRDNDIRMFHKTTKYESFFTDDLYRVHKEPAKTVFNIRRSDEGIRYWLSLSHSGKDIQLIDRGGFVLSNEPCLLVLGRDIFYFEDTDGKKLKPFFSKEYLSIPKSAEKKWFKSFASQAVRKYSVNAEGFEIEEIAFDFQPVLVLEQDWKNEFSFRLEFHYGEHRFLAGDPQKTRVLFDDEQIAFKKMQRSSSQEKKVINFLEKTSLKRFGNSNFKLGGKYDDKSVQKYDMLRWASENKDKIESDGLEIRQKFRNKNYLTEIPSLDFSAEAKGDWFDLKGVAKFGKFEIPFVELYDTILSGNREFELPDGTIALIPEEWFAKYTDILQLSQKDDDSLKLAKHHFSVLSEKKIELPESSYFKDLHLLDEGELPPVEIPEDIRAELRPYQKDGFKRLYLMQSLDLGMCLADDMGLGKTLQTITLLQKLKDDRKVGAEKIGPAVQKPEAGQLSLFASQPQAETPDKEKSLRKPALIVMPVSLIHNWKNEIMKFSPFLKMLQYHGGRRFRKQKSFARYDVILTGYGVVRNDIEDLEKMDFSYVILDESQYIKNPDSQIYKAVMRLQSDHRLVLTGTPIENSLSDLWAQMNFINPGLLGNRHFFKENLQVPIERDKSPEHAQKIKLLTNPFILRRTKSQVESDLPPLSEQVIYCRMSKDQKKIYEFEKSKIRNELLESYNNKEVKKNPVRVIQALSKLRQIANHPVLTDSEYDEDSGKFSEIVRAVDSITQENHKVLIFSSFVKHLNLFGEVFDRKQMKYAMLTGKTSKREEVIEKFQNDPETRIFLISLKAGGTGLNLTAADYVFISDPWWNPAAEKQAVNRAHRIGQDKKVMVYKYISRQTVEEKILKLQETKQKLSDEIITGENILKFTDEKTIRSLFE
jgi:SNF2 family DNA or RNA helicase